MRCGLKGDNIDLDECIEWQVNYGYQKFEKFLIKIHKNTPETANFSLFIMNDLHVAGIGTFSVIYHLSIDTFLIPDRHIS